METKTKSLSISEILTLGVELNGAPSRGIKGLLSLDMKFKLRYKLTPIAKQAQSEFDEFQSITNKAIEKYGEKEGETFVIPQVVKVGGSGKDKNKDIPNPKLKEYMDEVNEVLKLKKDINIPSILSIDEFDELVTNEDCSILISLLD